MIEFTEKDKNDLKNDPIVLALAKYLGINNVSEAVDRAFKRIEDAEKEDVKKKEYIKPKVEIIDVPVYSGKTVLSNSSDNCKAKEQSGKEFLIKEKGLEHLVNELDELEKKYRKLKHNYGIDLNNAPASKESIYNMYNKIIWKLIMIIFGDDNASKIEDFVYGGTSEYASVHDLYKSFV